MPDNYEWLGDCDYCGEPIHSQDDNFGWDWDDELEEDTLHHNPNCCPKNVGFVTRRFSIKGD